MLRRVPTAISSGSWAEIGWALACCRLAIREPRRTLDLVVVMASWQPYPITGRCAGLGRHANSG